MSYKREKVRLTFVIAEESERARMNEARKSLDFPEAHGGQRRMWVPALFFSGSPREGRSGRDVSLLTMVAAIGMIKRPNRAGDFLNRNPGSDSIQDQSMPTQAARKSSVRLARQPKLVPMEVPPRPNQSPSSPLRVLFFDHTAAQSGAEIAMLNLVRQLDRSK